MKEWIYVTNLDVNT